MENLLPVLIFIAVIIFGNITDKKKPKVKRQPSAKRKDIKIRDIKPPTEKRSVLIQQPVPASTIVPEVVEDKKDILQEKYLAQLKKGSKEAMEKKKATTEEVSVVANVAKERPGIEASGLRQGIIWAEVLGRPKGARCLFPKRKY